MTSRDFLFAISNLDILDSGVTIPADFAAMAAATDSCSADDKFAGSSLNVPGVCDSAPAAAADASAATLACAGGCGCDDFGLRVWIERLPPR